MANLPKFGKTIKLNKEAPKIPVLMFADDSIIFCRANKIATNNIKHVLDHHCTVASISLLFVLSI